MVIELMRRTAAGMLLRKEPLGEILRLVDEVEEIEGAVNGC
jgi:hypothetical protein